MVTLCCARTRTYRGLPRRCARGVATRVLSQQDDKEAHVSRWGPGHATRDPAFLSQQRAAEDRTRARLPLAVPVVPGMSRPPPPRDRKVAPCVLGSATKSTARYARAKPEACDRARSVATPRVLLRHGDGLPGAMSVVSWCVSWHVCGAVHASVSMFAISYTCRYLSNPLIP